MFRLCIHGGAGTITSDLDDAYRNGLRAALDRGTAVLAAGGPASEAVLAAVACMEDNPQAFNAGTGGVPNRDGLVECDAAIMSWDPQRSASAQADQRCGAVAGLTRARNPIRIADQVRRETGHVLIAGPGADALVAEPIANDLLLTPRMRDHLARWQAAQGRPDVTNTVGAVALDAHGCLAAATSTGGLLGKLPGRIGDSPLIGAGTWAGPQVAISCTGIGESFIRAVTARSVALRLEQMDLQRALQAALDDIAAEAGHGGIIAVTPDGRCAYACNSPQLAVAWSDPGSAATIVDTGGVAVMDRPADNDGLHR